MSELLITVEEAARKMQLHPKTILRAIHDGRLAANRIGKSYRIRMPDLNAFSGFATDADAAELSASATSIVDLAGLDADIASRIVTSLQGSLMSQTQRPHPVRLDVVENRNTGTMKLIIVAPPAESAMLLQQLALVLQQR